MPRRHAHRPPRPAPPSPPSPTDAELVTALRSAGGGAPHDHPAYAALVARHQRAVFGVALALLHDATEAEDMVQEAFLRAFRNLDLLADPARFGPWLRRIAFGVCVDWLRTFRPALHASLYARGIAGDAEGVAEAVDPAPSALERVERGELAARVRAALDRLPARYRVPLTLFHVDGVSHARVAAALGVTEGTARSLVTRARRKLAALLAHDPDAPRMRHDPSPGDPLDAFAPPPAHAPRLLHVLNGDVLRDKLARSDVPGTLAVWADVLHEGPVPPDSGTAAWREARVRHHTAHDATGQLAFAETLGMAEGWDAALERQGEYDEVVLWFEHDLFDQLLLVRHLDWLARRRVPAARRRLVMIGEFPGVDRFIGLGQLGPDQLASLLGTRQPVSDAVVAVGRSVWRAFTAGDLLALATLAGALGGSAAQDPEGAAAAPVLPPLDGTDAWALRFLGDALVRLLEELPATRDGLPRTERQLLHALAAGPQAPLALFRAVQDAEARPFMGDWTFWGRLRVLAAGPAPLVALDVAGFAPAQLAEGMVTITDAGRAVLAGRADWVRLGGMDRWVGGAHPGPPAGRAPPLRGDGAGGGDHPQRPGLTPPAAVPGSPPTAIPRSLGQDLPWP